MAPPPGPPARRRVQHHPPFLAKRWTGRRDRVLQLAARWAGAGLDRSRLGLPLIVPSCIDLDGTAGPAPIIVIKFVSSLGQARLLNNSAANLILILRHPCAYVASILGGIWTGTPVPRCL